MNRYEMVNIIDVNWGEGDQSRAEAMIKEEIAKAGGTVEESGGMGRRRLAYEIDGHSEGLYLLTLFSHPGEAVVSLQNALKLNPAVIRTLIVCAPSGTGVEKEEEKPSEPEPEPASASSPAADVEGGEKPSDAGPAPVSPVSPPAGGEEDTEEPAPVDVSGAGGTEEEAESGREAEEEKPKPNEEIK